MSLIKSIRKQLGLSVTPANNFTLTAEAANGTMKLARGNAGATTQDIMTVDASGKVAFPQNEVLTAVTGTVTSETGALGTGAGWDGAMVRSGRMAHIDFSCYIDTVGTGGGALILSGFPVAANRYAYGVFRGPTGLLGQVVMNQGASYLTLYKADNTTAIAAASNYRGSISFIV